MQCHRPRPSGDSGAAPCNLQVPGKPRIRSEASICPGKVLWTKNETLAVWRVLHLAVSHGNGKIPGTTTTDSARTVGTTMELLSTIICMHVFPLHIRLHIWSHSAANRTNYLDGASLHSYGVSLTKDIPE